MDSSFLALGIVWYVCFLFSLTCHEAAHALVAMWGGDLTAAKGGQVTLNPIPHVQREPFGTVIVPIIAYALSGWMIGWASAPYDPMWRARYPSRAALMALAGPAANILIVIAAGIAIRLLIAFGVFALPEYVGFASLVAMPDGGAISPLGAALSILFSLNLLLAVFNLIPMPPLDGSAAIGLVIGHDLAARYQRFISGGPFALLGIIIAWQLIGVIFRPAFRLAIDLLYIGAR